MCMPNKHTRPRSCANREAAAVHNTGKGAQVDQDVDQGVLVEDGLSIADLGPLDAEFLGPGVDAFGGHTLLVDIIVAVDQPVKSNDNVTEQASFPQV